MVECAEILIVIPARGGSKRLPHKNILPLAGKPLICHTIEVALRANLEARIMVTSDDEEILRIAQRYQDVGVLLHRRPPQLATDSALTSDVLVDAIRAERSANYDPDTLILLQPTSPLRETQDIFDGLALFREHGCENSVVSVCRVDHPASWRGMLQNGMLCGIKPLEGSKHLEPEFRLNGAIYVASVRRFLEMNSVFTETLHAHVMPEERSVDVDTLLQFRLCETLISMKAEGIYK